VGHSLQRLEEQRDVSETSDERISLSDAPRNANSSRVDCEAADVTVIVPADLNRAIANEIEVGAAVRAVGRCAVKASSKE
jgi:hypothetical protein